MIFFKRFFLACVISIIAASAFAESPNLVVEEAAAILDKQLAERKDEIAKDKEALYALIDEILLPRFDRKYSATLVLGAHWRTATPEQREAFIAAFYKSLRNRYAEGILKFEQSNIDVQPFRGDETKKRATVKTVVTLGDGKTVIVNYGVVNRDGRWLIFDVVIEGISYIVNFRAEVNSEIQNTSLDALIERLQSEVGGAA